MRATTAVITTWLPPPSSSQASVTSMAARILPSPLAMAAVAAGTDLLLSLVLANLPLAALPVEYAGLVCPVVLVWYIVTELGSMVENAVVMGAPVPKWLVKLLALGKDAVDSAGDKLGGEGKE